MEFENGNGLPQIQPLSGLRAPEDWIEERGAMIFPTPLSRIKTVERCVTFLISIIHVMLGCFSLAICQVS